MAGNPNQPWVIPSALALNGVMHRLPKHAERLLPKYDPDLLSSPEDHIKKYLLAIHFMNVQHEDIVCRLFPYTFENKASTWYFNLPVG